MRLICVNVMTDHETSAEAMTSVKSAMERAGYHLGVDMVLTDDERPNEIMGGVSVYPHGLLAAHEPDVCIDRDEEHGND